MGSWHLLFDLGLLHGQTDREVGREDMEQSKRRMRPVVGRLTVAGALVLAMPMLADVAIPYVCFLLVILDHLKFYR